MSEQTTPTKITECTNPGQIVNLPDVKERFIAIFEAAHFNPNLSPEMNRKMAENTMVSEQANFLKVISEKGFTPTDMNSQKFKTAVFMCFLDVAMNGLSYDPMKKLMYVVPRSAKTGVKLSTGKDEYVKIPYNQIAPDGEVVLRQRAGQIKGIDRPTVVYEGDSCRIVEKEGKRTVEYAADIAGQDTRKVIAVFSYLHLPDGSREPVILTSTDFQRYRVYSDKQNNYGKNSENLEKANELYTSWNGGIDPGFAAAKLIKHAFKGKPRVRAGAHSFLESEIEEQQERAASMYGNEEITPTPVEETTPVTDEVQFTVMDTPTGNPESSDNPNPNINDF